MLERVNNSILLPHQRWTVAEVGKFADDDNDVDVDGGANGCRMKSSSSGRRVMAMQEQR